MIFDVLERKLVRTIEMEVEQQMNPAFSPDGRTVAFAGNRAGRFDIYMVDLETERGDQRHRRRDLRRRPGLLARTALRSSSAR